MLDFLKNSNIPILVIEAVVIYFLVQSNIELREEKKQAEANYQAQVEMLNTVQTYNEQRFKEIMGVKDAKWKHGKNIGSY